MKVVNMAVGEMVEKDTVRHRLVEHLVERS